MFIQIMRLSNKLDFARLGPFKIIKVLGPVTYKLDLLDSMRITRIHYVLLLELVDPEAPLMENMPDINPKS